MTHDNPSYDLEADTLNLMRALGIVEPPASAPGAREKFDRAYLRFRDLLRQANEPRASTVDADRLAYDIVIDIAGGKYPREEFWEKVKLARGRLRSALGQAAAQATGLQPPAPRAFQPGDKVRLLEGACKHAAIRTFAKDGDIVTLFAMNGRWSDVSIDGSRADTRSFLTADLALVTPAAPLVFDTQAPADMHKAGIRDDGTVDRPGLSVETHYRRTMSWQIPVEGDWVEIHIDGDGVDYETRIPADAVTRMAAAFELRRKPAPAAPLGDMAAIEAAAADLPDLPDAEAEFTKTCIRGIEAGLAAKDDAVATARMKASPEEVADALDGALAAGLAEATALDPEASMVMSDGKVVAESGPVAEYVQENLLAVERLLKAYDKNRAMQDARLGQTAATPQVDART